MSDHELNPKHRREPLGPAKQALHAIESLALLLVGSAMLGVWKPETGFVDHRTISITID